MICVVTCKLAEGQIIHARIKMNISCTVFFHFLELSEIFKNRKISKKKKQMRPSQGVCVWGGGVGGYLFFFFFCSPEINRFVPLFLKIKILISYVPCSPKIAFVPFIFRSLFPRSPEINTLVPQNPWGPHLYPAVDIKERFCYCLAHVI